MPIQPRDAQERNEHHHTHAVVKQRLARDLGLQRLGCAEALDDSQDRDRVGWRDDRAKDQAVDEADLDAEPAGENVGEPADDERRGDYSGWPAFGPSAQELFDQTSCNHESPTAAPT